MDKLAKNIQKPWFPSVPPSQTSPRWIPPPTTKRQKGVTFANSIRTSSSYLGPPIHQGWWSFLMGKPPTFFGEKEIQMEMLTEKSDDSSIIPSMFIVLFNMKGLDLYVSLFHTILPVFQGTPPFVWENQKRCLSPQIVSTNPRDCTKIRICGPIQVPADNNNQQQHHQRMKPKQRLGHGFNSS